MVATDAQVEPGSRPGGGALIKDPIGGTAIGVCLQFCEAELETWGLTLEAVQQGRQPIALCEEAMVPLTLWQWRDAFRGRSVCCFVNSTAAMAAFVKGASANQHLERIVNIFWMCGSTGSILSPTGLTGSAAIWTKPSLPRSWASLSGPWSATWSGGTKTGAAFGALLSGYVVDWALEGSQSACRRPAVGGVAR